MQPKAASGPCSRTAVRSSSDNGGGASRQTVLFDLDGTLTDPGEGIINSFLYALSKTGVRQLPDASSLGWIIGPPLHWSFMKAAGLNAEAAAAAVEHYREYFRDRGMFENTLIPGITAVLDDLAASNIRLFVATSKPAVFARTICDHFDLTRYFQDISGSELDGTRSDKAELIGFILSENALSADECMMVGDRHHDISGAGANGLRSTGVLWGYGSDNELTDAGADYIADTPAVLNDILKRWITAPTPR
jgi:phosphoglycolate phosphatase